MVKLQLARAAARVSNDINAKFHRIVWAPTMWTILMRHPLEVLEKFDQQLATDKIEGDSLSKFVDLNQHLSVLLLQDRQYPFPTAAMCLFVYHSEEDSACALTR